MNEKPNVSGIIRLLNEVNEEARRTTENEYNIITAMPNENDDD